MKAVWPIRIDDEVRVAFEKAAVAQGVDVSTLRRSAYDEFIANHPDFFDTSACIRTHQANVSPQEFAQ